MSIDWKKFQKLIKQRKWTNNYKKKNKSHVLSVERERNHKLRLQVLNYYSNGNIKCACCGIDDIIFLTVDHINNNGAEYRRQVKSKNIYSWLVRHNFPVGFQVLCMNCNWAKRYTLICPHQQRRLVVHG